MEKTAVLWRLKSNKLVSFDEFIKKVVSTYISDMDSYYIHPALVLYNNIIGLKATQKPNFSLKRCPGCRLSPLQRVSACTWVCERAR